MKILHNFTDPHSTHESKNGIKVSKLTRPYVSVLPGTVPVYAHYPNASITVVLSLSKTSIGKSIILASYLTLSYPNSSMVHTYRNFAL